MRRPSRRVLVTIALVAVAAVAAWAILPSRDEVFHAKVAELRAEGFAVSLPEFLGDAPPGAEDAAREIEAAHAALGAMGALPPDDELAKTQGFPWVRKLTGPWDVDTVDPWEQNATPEQMASLRAWLEEARPFYDRLSAAVARPAIRFPVAWDADGTSSLQHLRTVQDVQWLLAARALAAGDPAERIAACRDALRLGRRLRPQGTVELRVARAIEAGGTRTTRAGVESGDLSAARVREALGGDLGPRPPGDREFVARREVAFLATAWGNILRGVVPSWWKPPTPWERVRRSFEETVRGRPDEDLNSPGVADALALWASLARRGEDWTGLEGGASAATGGAAVKSSRTMVGQLDWMFRQQDAAAVLAQVALAVMAREEATRSWPAALDDVRDLLGGSVPADPYTGTSFVYEVRADVVRIASAGVRPGREPLPDADLREYGLLWEFPRR